MILLDRERTAERIVGCHLGLQQGQVVLISGEWQGLELIEDLAVAVTRVGSHPVLMVTNDRQVAGVECGRGNQEHVLRWLDDIDAIIDLDQTGGAARRERSELPTCSRDVNWLVIGCPTPELALSCGTDYQCLSEAYATALLVDQNRVAALAADIVARMAAGPDVRITSAAGSDLRLSVAGRAARIDDGVIDERDRELGLVTNRLPCGEVFFAPVESSVEGVAVFHRVACGGRTFDLVRVRFEGGRVVKVEPGDAASAFADQFSRAGGDCDRVGEFGIGLNPNLRQLTGDPALDEKMFGSVHLGLGDNGWFGGRNRSALHWNLIIPQPTVTAGGREICRDGDFLPLAG